MSARAGGSPVEDVLDDIRPCPACICWRGQNALLDVRRYALRCACSILSV